MPTQLIERIEDLPIDHDAEVYVIVDVLRFSTTVCHVLSLGAQYIRPFNDVPEALAFGKDKDAFMVGEQRGKLIDGFDSDNSPSDITREDVDGRPVGILTTNGTRALEAVRDSDNVFIGGLVNAEALGTFLRDRFDDITIIAAGTEGEVSDEDVAGAELIRRYIEHGTVSDSFCDEIRERVLTSTYAERVRERGHADDVEIAATVNRYPVVPHRSGNTIRLE